MQFNYNQVQIFIEKLLHLAYIILKPIMKICVKKFLSIAFIRFIDCLQTIEYLYHLHFVLQ